MNVIDPVCKMTIESSTAAAKTDYEGTTYYFCMEGCKTSFLADPKKFLPKQAGFLAKVFGKKS
jgi:Cu+-exporting ATPase